MAILEHSATSPLSSQGSLQERMLDSEEAAGLLRIHPKTLQRMARRGEVKGFRIGKLWRFRGSDLLADKRKMLNVTTASLGKRCKLETKNIAFPASCSGDTESAVSPCVSEWLLNGAHASGLAS